MNCVMPFFLFEKEKLILPTLIGTWNFRISQKKNHNKNKQKKHFCRTASTKFGSSQRASHPTNEAIEGNKFLCLISCWMLERVVLSKNIMTYSISKIRWSFSNIKKQVLRAGIEWTYFMVLFPLRFNFSSSDITCYVSFRYGEFLVIK